MGRSTYASSEYRLRESEGMTEHVRSGVGAGVVSTSQGDTIADDGRYAEVGCEVARGVDSPRRRWNEAQKRRIVAESYRSGDSVSGVAYRHDMHASVLFKWRRRYRKPADSGAEFVPIVVQTPEEANAAATGRMEIVLGGGTCGWSSTPRFTPRPWRGGLRWW